MPPQAKTLSLSEFHQQVDAIVEDGPALPRGPGESADTVPSARTRKWVVEAGNDGSLDVIEGPPPVATHLTIDQFKDTLDLCLREFLSGGDIVEATRCILEMSSPQFHFQVVKRGVMLAMDKAGREREMIAVLFDSLHKRGLLTSAQIVEGFTSLLESLEDVLLDTPAAPDLLAHFLADAILDRLLPANFSWPPELLSSDAVRRVLDEVSARLRGRVAVAAVSELRSSLRSILSEYLASHDDGEVVRRLNELNVPSELQHEIVRAAVEIALDRKDHERELVSQLISNLYDGAVSPHEIARGFEILISRIDDLTIDNPQAPTLLAAFLVRAVVDDVLPPAFVRQNPPEPLTTDLQLATLTQAKAQLAVSHFGDRRRKVWGAAADADVATLKHSVSELVREYLVGGDLNEAVRCLVELNAPSFYHEVVKRLVVLSLDHNSTEQQLARRLVGRLYGDRLLTEEQLLLGCKRLLEALPDLRLDNPKASEVLSEFFDSCCELDALAPSEDWREAIRVLRSGGEDAVALSAVNEGA
eukprot:CAMPEP_0181223624 /NCGR_PEP_ID=MMETSP1096-20121128/30649_1 /TAXON_ID=156174 ORGANISM="Chrysochromulina ericina, Strain CCMP281" /NCGR_SAMPLE_ID=MMETSP1096 /ASSEMBLY_ACC=CAM_ASM_000453 /LENGTH=529 /DNA_ID=CAMNT_0023316565 /DNA_START=8 /DNA_END=1597 /DNA_ORIENTATION=+